MNYLSAVDYIAQPAKGSRVEGSARHRVRRPHWHPHSFLFWSRGGPLCGPGVRNQHRPYWPLTDHQRIGDSTAYPSATEAAADDWQPYIEPAVGTAEYDKAYRAAMRAQKRGFK